MQMFDKQSESLLDNNNKNESRILSFLSLILNDTLVRNSDSDDDDNDRNHSDNDN